MNRRPTTFALVLALLALALLLALGLSAVLSARLNRQIAGLVYGRLASATAVATDELALRHDAEAERVLARLATLGVHLATGAPPPSTVRVAPVARAAARHAGEQLDAPMRVVVVQNPDTHLWVSSAHAPDRWIVMSEPSNRERVLASSARIAVLAGLIALALAALLARLLTRPLERLAGSAGALLAGEPVALDGSPHEVERLAQAFREAGARLRGSARERELMLAGISHDLRTPLARLRLALELGDAADLQRSEAMVADLEELDAALEQCLAFVRDGRDEAPDTIDLATLASQLLGLRHESDAWQLDGPDSLPVVVRPRLLRRAIGNLMDNAERHGAAPFRVAIGRDARGVFASVADKGLGVPVALLPQLGRPFLRGDRARSTAGTGLGIGIAMRAAELHGGALELANAPGGGFVATLRLPDLPPAH
ncbi:ATP-binding protein [Rhodanobacter geophilus]|uniref:histidine kinase n=1 Tax=Rhodanobacter geophilus TaxID=3162488 RepID=A0ABV3QNF7_9GAMM